jgi:putative tryptophan/tyrosine transport system substrate-binding protein
MKRRDFAAGLPLLAAVRSALAQSSPRQYRIAIIAAANPAKLIAENSEVAPWRGFFEELRKRGYVEGKNLVIERYSGEGNPAGHSALAHAVVSGHPDLVITATTLLAQAVKAETRTIPIVATMLDPIGAGLAASLARPGGNVTGVTTEGGIEIWGKRLQILKEIVPSISRVAFLTSEAGWDRSDARELRAAGEQLGILLISALPKRTVRAEFERVFTEVGKQRPDGIVVSAEGELWANRQQITELVNHTRLPAIYAWREYVEAGGLISYASDLTVSFRRMAGKVAEVLDGANPADIPIEQATKFNLALNLKTAKQIGINIPLSLLARADEVIE